MHGSLPSSRNGFDPRRPLLGTRSSAAGASLRVAPARTAGRLSSADHGEWRSLVAHPAGGRAVAGSNPVSPIGGKPRSGEVLLGEDHEASAPVTAALAIGTSLIRSRDLRPPDRGSDSRASRAMRVSCGPVMFVIRTRQGWSLSQATVLDGLQGRAFRVPLPGASTGRSTGLGARGGADGSTQLAEGGGKRCVSLPSWAGVAGA
ncbi:MAG: hypothetical protein QOF83_1892 [Solirubrobacteraceae bacterium]|nr:hypothetical protein [Solirubrobacteraceae bacterium]